MRAAEVAAIVAALAWLWARNASAGPVSPAREVQGGVPPVRTGRGGELRDAPSWAKERAVAVAQALREGAPESELTLDARRAVVVALLAQAGVESGYGRNEWNHNAWGWKPRAGQPFTVLRDATTRKPMRYAAYPSADDAAAAHVAALRGSRYRSAWDALLAAPESDAWIRELHRAGYFESDPDAYAAAWRSGRAMVAQWV